MAGRVKVRAIKRKQIDEDKLAMAFIMLAKSLHEQSQATATDSSDDPPSAQKMV